MNTHIINKQIIDLKVYSEENAFGFQQEVRDAYLTNVLPLIGEVLDELAGPDEVLRIDRLELDFGILSPHKMAQQMKERIREALLKQLPELKRKTLAQGKQNFSIIETVVDGKRSKAQLMSESFSQRELLEIYFETGFLPWWATDELDAPDIDLIIISLFEKEPVATLQWLQKLAIKSPSAIRRMLMQIEKPTRKQILAAFPEKIIAGIEVLAKQFQQVQSSVNHFPWQNEQVDSILFSALILPAEIIQADTANTNGKILEALIVQLSIVYRTTPVDIEKQLYADTLSKIIHSHNKLTVAPDLVEHFISWEKEHSEIASSVTGSNFPALELLNENDGLNISELVDTIEQALKEFEEKQSVVLSRRKKQLIKGKNKSQQQKLETKQAPGAEQNISGISPESGISVESKNDIPVNDKPAKISTDLKDAEGNSTDDSIDDNSEEIKVHDENGFVKINWFKTNDEKSEPEKLSGKIEFGSDEISPLEKSGITKLEAENVTAISEKNKIEEATEAKENVKKPEEQETFESSDEAEKTDFFLEDHPMLRKKPSAGMTRFGGLVIIAPFLPAFFAELKLTVDGKFISENEQHKALHLLNYIASGKTSSPEYALLLHKLLCGIEVTKPVPKTIKLSAAEKKEAIIFLDDVAGQWTVLGGTSGKAFRNTFFRRNGILEKKDGTWLLRVERGPMDIMLETLPWTISIIKAPWMQQLLQVEW